MPWKHGMRKNVILPFSFFILWVFLAFRYYYGLDYEAYLFDFSNPKNEDVRSAEFIFWYFFHSFRHFYQFIIVHTTIVLLTLFYLTRKYVSPTYYAFVFFVFMCHPGMMFNYISAMRSSLAGCAFIWIADLTFIRHKRIWLFIPLIFATSFIHKSALMLLTIPLVDLFAHKIRPKVWLILVIAETIISMTALVDYTKWFMEDGFVSERYIEYIVQDKFYNSTFKNIIIRLFMVYPFYQITKVFSRSGLSDEWKKIYTIALAFFALYFVGVDFQNRLTVLVYYFVLLAIFNSFNHIKTRWVIQKTQWSLIAFVFLQMFLAFWGLSRIRTTPGNYWYYKSLLNIPFIDWP